MRHAANARALNSAHTRRKGLPALLSFLMGQKISIPSKFKFEFAYYSTVHATSRRRDVHYDAAESVWFLSVITAPEHFTVRSFILHPLSSPRTCFTPPPSRVKYTYVPDICASHSSRPFFHSRGIKYPCAYNEKGRMHRAREERG